MNKTHIEGAVWKFGDDVNTDVIHPPQFFSLDDEVVKSGLFNGLDSTLQPRLRPGDIFVAGRNFGVGSSRETSIRSLILNRVGAIVAISFARIFFRNAVNNGLRCFELIAADDFGRIDAGAPAVVDLDACALRQAGKTPVRLHPPNAFVNRIWEAGGLLETLA